MSKFVLNQSRIQQTVEVTDSSTGQSSEMIVQPQGRVRLGMFDRVSVLPAGCSLLDDSGKQIVVPPLPQHVPDPVDASVDQPNAA